MDPRYRGIASAGGGFNALAAGGKSYGGGRSMPNLGPVQNRLGYQQRDNAAAARRNLVLKRMQQNNGMKFQVM